MRLDGGKTISIFVCTIDPKCFPMQMKSYLRFLTLFFAATLGLVGCGPAADKSEKKTRIICTTGMVSDLVKQVVGNDAVVNHVIPSGLDPHTYKPTPQDVSEIMSADIVVYSGIGLEAKLEEILDNYGKQEGHTVFSLGAALPDSALIYVENGHSVDPHFWFDLELWSLATTQVEMQLSEQMPDFQAVFKERARQYKDSLQDLKGWAQTQLSQIPSDQRVLVTVHDAFSYFGQSFEIEVRGLLGISPELDAGVQDVSSLVDFLVENEIRAVFVEESLPTRTMEAVVAGCQTYGHKVLLGEKLYADNVGAEGTPQDTYIGMVKHNIQTIVSALK